jgi:hypothetical protein
LLDSLLKERNMLSRRPSRLISSCQYTTRLYNTSFNTDPEGTGYHMLSYTNAASCILTGKPNFPFPAQYNIDLDTFFTGSRKAVESISRNISLRNISGLSSLVSPTCLEHLRQCVFEEMRVEDIRGIKINADDIFLQYIESAQIQDKHVRIVLVSFSLDRLHECKSVHSKLKTFQNQLFNKAKQTDGILRREDLNAKEFRRLQGEFENLNMDKLTKEGNILVSSYTFERTGNTDWSVVSLSHTDSALIWSYVRRMIWKGRVHISARFDKRFDEVLRLDYALDFFAVVSLIFLQLLAMILGYKMEQEQERRNRMEEQERLVDLEQEQETRNIIKENGGR